MRLLVGIVALGSVAEAAQYLVSDLSFGFGARYVQRQLHTANELLLPAHIN